MPAPTGSDGVRRAIQEVLLPPIGVLVVVAVVRELVGPVMAGVVYVALLGGVFLGIYAAATHWNVAYTAGFVLAGAVLFGLAPSVVAELVHPVFGVLGTVLGAVFLVGMVVLFLRKAGLGDPFDDW